MTDHRIGLSVNGLERIMSGEDLSTITDALNVNDEKERLVDFMNSIS